MTFAFCATSWAELSYLVVVEKQGDTYTAHRFWEETPIGKVNLLEDGWIEVVINYSEFNQELLAGNTEIGMVYVSGGTGRAAGGHEVPFTIKVAVDWDGIELVDAY